MNVNGINGLGSVSNVGSIGSVTRNQGAKVAQKPLVRDEMELSTQNAVRTADSIAMTPNEIRVDLVNRVRAEIAAGTYYTDEKFDIAISRMFDSFAD
ncbi:MAG: flagellar biosynthesis anti-sigma factor FlgM [Thermoguttaceae bacterium]|nr:flagellar biosynthesis anti-sigma factor FlgM [Thermoguttaceae bacterium]